MKRAPLIFLYLIFSILNAYSQYSIVQSDEAISLGIERSSGIFESDEILDVSLEFDITRFMSKKSKEEYLDAALKVITKDSVHESFNVRVRARGNSRLELCSFPPIRINLNGTETGYSDLDAIKNMKLVTHCEMKQNEDLILKEYLAYRMYNTITEYSFKVRLLRISYIDTGHKQKDNVSYGILIEPVNMLEKRLESLEIENIKLRHYHYNNDVLDRMSIFQFMIGNTDWQAETYHNVKIIKGLDEKLGNPIPYDFDYSGLVNAYYAIPRGVLDIDSVRQRYFQGVCRDKDDYVEILAEFSQAKKSIYGLINQEKLLSSKGKKYMTKYLDGFYNILEKDRIVAVFNSSCLAP